MVEPAQLLLQSRQSTTCAELRSEHIRRSFADFAIQCNNGTAMKAIKPQTGEIGISLPDPLDTGILLQPAFCLETTRHYVEIETGTELTRGMTAVDRLNVPGIGAFERAERVGWRPAETKWLAVSGTGICSPDDLLYCGSFRTVKALSRLAASQRFVSRETYA